MNMATEAEITEKTKAIMNEAGEDTNEGLLDEDTVRIDEYIRKCIPDAVSLVIQNSTGRCVNPRYASGSSSVSNGDGSGYIVVPDDYVRLVAFRMKGWKRTVAIPFMYGTPEAAMQSNRYTRGGKCKPACVEGRSASGRKTIEYYSIGKNETPQVDMFVYEASYDSMEGLPVSTSDPLFAAVCYMTASLVYAIFENQATSKEMQVIAINILNNAVQH